MIKTDNTGVLLCPNCGFEYTHMEYVHISTDEQRDNDYVVDAKTGEIEGWSNNKDSHFARQVSGWGHTARGHGIAVMGWCEGCGCSFALVFAQHKGYTHCSVLKPPYDVGSYDSNPFLGGHRSGGE